MVNHDKIPDRNNFYNVNYGHCHHYVQSMENSELKRIALPDIYFGKK